MALDPDTNVSPPRGLLAWTLKVSAVIGLGAVALAHHLADPAGSHGSAGPQVARLAGDPETTGAIGPKARETRLDPCALRGGR